MILKQAALDSFRNNLEIIAASINLETKNENGSGAKVCRQIMTADEIMARWYNANFTPDEFIEVCSALDNAIDALAEYDEEKALSLIITRYYLERIPKAG